MNKTPWLLAACILIALSSVTLLTLHSPAQAAPPSAAKLSMPPAPQEALDVGDRAELLEHWSNPSYSEEERKQIVGLAVLLTGLAVLAYRRRLALRRAYRDV